MPHPRDRLASAIDHRRACVWLAWVTAVVGCTSSAPTTPVNTSSTLHIAALNDFHGALYEIPVRDEDGRARGGLPWLHAAVTDLRAQHPDLLVLDGGDLFQGSWPVNQTRGMGAVKAYDLLGVDAIAVGNHEFDYGGDATTHPLRGALERAAAAASFTWLTANVFEADGRPLAIPGIERWTIIERSGVKVGVFGLTTTSTPQTTLAVNVADLTFTDVVVAAREAVAALEAAGADLVIMVGHLTGSCQPHGFVDHSVDCATPGAEIGALLDQMPPGAIDVMITGHAHTVLAQRFGDTYVLQNRSSGQAIGRIDLVVGPDGIDHEATTILPHWELVHDRADPACSGSAFPLGAIDVGGRSLEPSAAAIALIGELEAETGSLCEKLGCAGRDLGRSRDVESEVGNLVTDAMRAAFPDVDVAITNSGGLRADLPRGEVRREHVQAVMPFDNRVVLLEMPGSKLRRLLSLGASGAHGVSQISGGSFRFDPERTGGEDLDGDGEVAQWEADRLCWARVGGEPVDPDKTYRVVVNDFMVGGGDHLGPAFEGVDIAAQGPLLRDVIGGAIAENAECIGAVGPLVTPASPRIEVGACAAR